MKAGDSADQNQSSMGSAESGETTILQKVLNDKAYFAEFQNVPPVPEPIWRPLLGVGLYLTYLVIIMGFGFFFLHYCESHDCIAAENTTRRDQASLKAILGSLRQHLLC
ncbi:unnamed protein product [Bursaphelenchus xylophilus]|uniref:(pine wood nematode) hypothetical protein n=1 Tax=Bursaphelenchus xylophilus TaxID=6326 RepID=A0A7I8X6R0_BURXY|nr:unnamed protein product [Bursaphelenchus xylophilus]CAG9123235.1 unnamed protein product [Bursaphelenchus xylophilus]